VTLTILKRDAFVNLPVERTGNSYLSWLNAGGRTISIELRGTRDDDEDDDAVNADDDGCQNEDTQPDHD